MNISDEDYRQALVLGVLSNYDGVANDGRGMTDEEISEAIEDMSDVERLDIVARYQEYDPNP